MDKEPVVLSKATMNPTPEDVKRIRQAINDALGRRPWGLYQVLYEGPDCKVKRIIVKPEQRLSLQSHEFRDEVWTLVEGSALIEIGGSEHIATPDNDYGVVFIRRGEKHRIKALGEGVVFIEVQVGESFDEGDITRYEDDYGRVKNDNA